VSNDIVSLLNGLIGTTGRCRERECVINNKCVKVIFSPESFLSNDLKKILPLVSGNYKICDCIVICENLEIVLIEILCGQLTKDEFEDKLKQLDNCKRILKKFNLREKRNYIIFKRLSSKDKRYILGKLPKLKNRQNIDIKEFKNEAIVVCECG
jgi:hypothetical protein